MREGGGGMSGAFVASDDIRAAFSAAMSAMYRAEVPLYGDLLELVAGINATALADDPDGRGARSNAENDRLEVERHGAIRVGTAGELSILRRLFAIMGMRPVGYYDLAAAGIPVHATAFRPVEQEALDHNPFRIFTSLLRLDLIEDDDLRARAAQILSRRRIVAQPTLDLIERHERQGGLNAADAAQIVAAATAIFRWHERASVDLDTYRRFQQAHRLIADVVCFPGPHINHLTPRVLDIEAAQVEMMRRGIPAKAHIEGPPERKAPILLRQTSFQAIEEPIRFPGPDGEAIGSHTARFGEVEQRGVALTRAGRALYDALLAAAAGGAPDEQDARLRAAFVAFPDMLEELRSAGLAYYRYVPTRAGLAASAAGETLDSLAELLDAGWLAAEPITYEDFLPVSAAGIFRSNLAGFSGDDATTFTASARQAEFEAALGTAVLDPFLLYDEMQQQSLDRVGALFGMDIAPPLARSAAGDAAVGIR